MRTPIIGVLGGMGPAASASFYTRLVQLTPATTDQEHFPVVMWADPTVPDRTAALLGHGESILPWLETGVARLENAGATLLAAPCNTAHIWLPSIVARREIELVSIVEATAAAIATRPGTVGILGTDATLSSSLYQEALAARGLKAVVPEPESQTSLVEAIYAIKHGGRAQLARADQLLATVIASIHGRGADVVVNGCTEISMRLHGRHWAAPVVDSLEELVRATIRRAADAVRGAS